MFKQKELKELDVLSCTGK